MAGISSVNNQDTIARKIKNGIAEAFMNPTSKLLKNTVKCIKEIIKYESEIDLLGPSTIYYQKLFCGGGDVSNNRRCSGQ